MGREQRFFFLGGGGGGGKALPLSSAPGKTAMLHRLVIKLSSVRLKVQTNDRNIDARHA